MKPDRPSIDGFIPRRGVSSNATHGHRGLQPSAESGRGLIRHEPVTDKTPPRDYTALRPEQRHGLSRAEIDESLRGIDDELPKSRSRQGRRRDKLTRKRLVKRVVIGLLLLALLVGGYLGVKVLIASGNIFKGNLLGLVQSAPLKTDAAGRSNILIFGTSEDSAAHKANGGEGAPFLTDSMMVVSVDQEEKDAYMVSVPRDLYVDFDGQPCTSGYSGRINEVYQCFSNFGEDEAAGTEALRKKVGQVTGLDIQYTAQVNYTVVKDVVDAIGGISVEIDSDDPRGVYDPNFDWQCNHQCNMVKYPNGPTGNIDGDHALALARARNAAGGYGLARGNFDREQYQQKILKAIRDKAVSAGTLADIGKVTSLIDALGDNLRTNFETKEIRTLMSLGTDIPSDKINSINLDQASPPIYSFVNVGGGSMITPTSGDFDYTSIKQYIQQQISSDPVVREQAKIGIYNGSSLAGAAGQEADKLRLEGYSIVDGAVGNAPSGDYATYELYDMTQSKPATIDSLESRYGVTAKTSAPPVAVTGLDIVIVIGGAPPPESTE